MPRRRTAQICEKFANNDSLYRNTADGDKNETCICYDNNRAPERCELHGRYYEGVTRIGHVTSPICQAFVGRATSDGGAFCGTITIRVSGRAVAVSIGAKWYESSHRPERRVRNVSSLSDNRLTREDRRVSRTGDNHRLHTVINTTIGRAPIRKARLPIRWSVETVMGRSRDWDHARYSQQTGGNYANRESEATEPYERDMSANTQHGRLVYYDTRPRKGEGGETAEQGTPAIIVVGGVNETGIVLHWTNVVLGATN